MSRQGVEEGKAWVENTIRRLTRERGLEVTAPFQWRHGFDRDVYYLEVVISGIAKRWSISAEKLEDCVADKNVQRYLQRTIEPDLVSASERPVRSAGGTEASDGDNADSDPQSALDESQGAANNVSATNRRLSVFLCHSSVDKLSVRNLYQRLLKDGFDPWLDKERILGGQDWEREVKIAVRESHAVIVCLTRSSVTKEGFVQKEIRIALDVADEKPEGTIYVIPLKLEECEVPERLRQWHWLNLFEASGYDRLARSLRMRATALNFEASETKQREQGINTRREVSDSSKGMLSAEEVVILVAASEYHGEIIKDSSQQIPDYLLIGPLCFPPDWNDPDPSPEAIESWIQGFQLARTQGFTRYDAGNIHKMTVQGYDLIRKFRNLELKTREGAPAWEAFIRCLGELRTAQDQAQNPPQDPATHEKIRQNVERLLEMAEEYTKR